MANGRGDDFTPLVRLMRTVISIHYPRRIAQVFFSKKPKKFPRVSPPDFAFGKEGGQACRSRPREIPHKSPALPDFYTTASGHVSRAAPAVQGRGGYRFRFLRNRKRIQGGQRPPWNSRQRIKFVIVRGFVTGGSMPALSITLSIHAMLRPSFSMTSTPSVSCMTSPLSAPWTAFQ